MGSGHGSPAYWRDVNVASLRRWVGLWLPSLESDLTFDDVGDDDFAYLAAQFGTGWRLDFAKTLVGKKVLVLTEPRMMAHWYELLREAAVIKNDESSPYTSPYPQCMIESVFKARLWKVQTEVALLTQFDVLVFETTFGDETKTHQRVREIARNFHGQVIAMGHFSFNAGTDRPPREAAAALKVHERPPVKVVWAHPPGDLRGALRAIGALPVE